MSYPTTLLYPLLKSVLAVCIVVGYWLVLPVVTTIWQILLLATALFLGGLALATFCKSLVDGPVAMALYEQATAEDEPTQNSQVSDTLRGMV